uniref:Sec-independent protein translocase protein TatA n=1 Tax=Desulfovibrio sp. U5L TaxID=596152 RepID=I2PYF8_9BACT
MFSGLLQPMHLLLILGVVLIVFGPGKLANLGHDLGKSIREFKSAMDAHDVTPEPVAEKPAQQAVPGKADPAA